MEIRNFGIIAHIDHGKSTLADRMLEYTKTVETRKMKEQVLDTMELERERGITIKMQPVRMTHTVSGKDVALNMIDTPGHIDFSYEVSRALRAVEGVLLLVDATQGVQAQTLTTLQMAMDQERTIIPVLTKTDMPHARITEVRQELVELIGCTDAEVLTVSGKTGDGVTKLLDTIVERVPAPEQHTANTTQSLVFDFDYSNHKGVIVFVRTVSGEIREGDELSFVVGERAFIALEVGVLTPESVPVDSLKEGEIGYVVTGIKEPGVARVGDTITGVKKPATALPGYQEPNPVVWASVYPESQDDFTPLKQALARLKLSDSSLSFQEESSGILGRGFRCGFLGMLHLEIITERLRREFGLTITVTAPSISYEITNKDSAVRHVFAASQFPDHGAAEMVREPWVLGTLMLPPEYLGGVMTLLFEHEAEVLETYVLPDGRNRLSVALPLRELMRNFFDRLKNVSSGYASLSYEIAEMRSADVARLDILIAEEEVPALARVVGVRRIETEARSLVDRLYNTLPRQQFVLKIQARALGRIIASKTLSALKKDVTAKLYGGDITRKMKLREKQKKGKAQMKARGKVHIPSDVFAKLLRSEE